jgi:hypothetical protein
MIYPARLVNALPLVFSVGADHDRVTFSVLVEPEPLVPPLDELLELVVVVVVVVVVVRGLCPWPAFRMEAVAVLPTLVVAAVPVLAGAATAAALAEPALCVEPPHPGSRNTVMAKAPRIWAKGPQRRSIFMCARLAN